MILRPTDDVVICVKLEWKIQDFWVGVYWHHSCFDTDIWICLLPCLPLHISYWSFK